MCIASKPRGRHFAVSPSPGPSLGNPFPGQFTTDFNGFRYGDVLRSKDSLKKDRTRGINGVRNVMKARF